MTGMDETDIPGSAPDSDGHGISFDGAVDARGLNCPLPILKAKKALATIQSGQVLKVTSTDPGSKRDFEAFARQTGNTLVGQFEADRTWTFYLKRR
jgi:tRNA 2-thiouridine synthesizing protein A